jgi:hypothetical protein
MEAAGLQCPSTAYTRLGREPLLMTKIYICPCGREFKTASGAFNHKQGCKTRGKVVLIRRGKMP